MPLFVVEGLFYIYNPAKRNFNVSSLKDQQMEAAVHLLQSKDIDLREL